jgi:hypothetical protein
VSEYAVLLNSSTEDVWPTANGLEYALDLDEGGHEVDVYFDGAPTQRPRQLAEKPNHPINNFFDEADDRGLIAGACGFCADSFDATEGCGKASVDILGGAAEHAPRPSQLVDDEYELLTIG